MSEKSLTAWGIANNAIVSTEVDIELFTNTHKDMVEASTDRAIALEQQIEAYAAQEVAKVSTVVHAAAPYLLDALEHCLNAMAFGETPSGWTDYESWCATLREGKPLCK